MRFAGGQQSLHAQSHPLITDIIKKTEMMSTNFVTIELLFVYVSNMSLTIAFELPPFPACQNNVYDCRVRFIGGHI